MTRTLITLLLAGDVMTGRGIDQILPHANDPTLHESYVKDARRYVRLAEQTNGPIPDDVPLGYIWHDALPHFQSADARVINLETAVTTSDDHWPNKGIHYRMHPANAPLLTTASIDAAALANNHTLDWGRDGLAETLTTLHDTPVKTAGAGPDLPAATTPAIIEPEGQPRVLVFAYATPDAGVPQDWAATQNRSGIALLPDLTNDTFQQVARNITAHAQEDDIVILSIHWGGNWGYDVPPAQRRFAHKLIDEAGVDVVHGHSSHHPRPIEVHADRLILYGCGDLINDYEGIGGHDRFRPELSLLYLPKLHPDGRLDELTMAPFRIEKMRLNAATEDEARWLADRLDRESAQLGVNIQRADDNTLTATW